jgi:NADPH:quinone reductase-like Zn-dependent oxidoreductase
VVEPDRTQLTELTRRLRKGQLKPLIGAVRPLAETPAAMAQHRRTPGRTIIQVVDDRSSA